MINTKKVQGRRTVRYASLDELLADARSLAAADVRMLGNWSRGQIYEHLAMTLNSSIDGFDMSFPAPLRLIMALFMKKKFLEREVPSGFSAPDNFRPDDMPVEEGLASLEQAIVRQAAESKRAIHPGLGNLSRDEWTKFHLRHAEMHMSFIVPVKSPATNEVSQSSPVGQSV